MQKLGMYAINDADYPKVTIGKYTICRQDESSVWIAHEDGEAGQFHDNSFEKAVGDYFEENF